MSDSLTSRFVRWLLPHLPRTYREGRMPYVFSLALVVMVLMLAFAWVSPYLHARAIGLGLSLVILVMLVMVAHGLSVNVAIHTVLVAATCAAFYAAWLGGGIFSPRMAWLAALPLPAFYAISRRTGWLWVGMVLMAQLAMAYLTYANLLGEPFHFGVAQMPSSLFTNSLVIVLIVIMSLLFDNLYRVAYKVSRKRNQELEDKRQELLRTSQIREHFIATVSHELRTPLNAILGFNAMLLARVKDKPQSLKILNHTRQSADHLLTVINDVLDHSQLQAGKLSVHAETFALRDTVCSAFELFKPRVESMRLGYQCLIEEDVPHWVRTDRHRLMQILVNLLGNAIKFTHQGHVILRVSKQGAGVAFSVEDTGIGIAESQKPLIFQRFSQADSEIHTRYGGNGLGLSITQRLVILLQGHIGFDSSLGQGSRFWFDLPLVEVPEPEQGAQVGDVSADLADLPLRFLVTDDHPLNRFLVVQTLKTIWKNCQLVEAENGLKALQALRGEPFDVVLMDMVMPEMDGIEATRSLRMDFPAPVCQTPVLGLTANVNPQDLDRFKAAGVNATLLKPFDQTQLRTEVERLLRSSPLTAQISFLGS